MTAELASILKNIFTVEKFSECFSPYSHSEELNEQKIIPVVMIKMISKFLDHFINQNTYHLIVKTIRKNHNIEAKFNLSKYQLTRIFLEVIFEKTKTLELDYLFEQLKIYGNYVLDVSSSYQEIIENVIQCHQKSNQHIQNVIDDLTKKLEKIKRDYAVYPSKVYQESIINLESRIDSNKARLSVCEKETVEREIYEQCQQICKRISIKNKDILKEKIMNYLSSLESSVMKNIDDFEKINQENVFGKKFETIIYSRITPLLKEHGYEVLFNSEFEFDSTHSGVKLEYDFIIGKIINNIFIIYGVFDAKIGKCLIKNDAHKLVKGVDFLTTKKISLRYVFKRQYQHLFRDIIAIKDEKILTGYFCQSFYNEQKEMSKQISAYMVVNGYQLFTLINGNTILLEPFRYELEDTINSEYYKMNEFFTNKNIIIYSIEKEEYADVKEDVKEDVKDGDVEDEEPSTKKRNVEK